MLNRKLLEIIRRFDLEEKKRFRQFLQSPYFTYGISNQEITTLYEYILRYGADEQAPALDKQRASARLFPDKPFVEKGKSPIDTLTSDLFKLVKKFLFIQSIEQDTAEPIKELPLARFYRRFGLEDRFWKTVRDMRNALDTISYQDERYFLTRYELEAEIATFKSLYNSAEDDANIGMQVDYLEQFFAIARLDMACALNFQSQKADVDPQNSPALAIMLMQLIREGQIPDNALAEIYTLVFEIINEPDMFEKIDLFKELLEQHKLTLPPNHLTNLMAYLRIFLMRRYRKQSNSEYLFHYFNLITKQLDEGYLYFEGKIVASALRNIAHSGLRLGAFDKVREILENHPPERIGATRYPVEFHSLNMANYYFAIKNYEKADEHLVYCNFENVHFSIQAEILLVKIYFETESDLLDPRIKALLQKVRRAKIAKNHKDLYLNFLNKLVLVIKYGWDKHSSKRSKLIEEIQQTPGLLEKEWLLRQLD